MVLNLKKMIVLSPPPKANVKDLKMKIASIRDISTWICKILYIPNQHGARWRSLLRFTTEHRGMVEIKFHLRVCVVNFHSFIVLWVTSSVWTSEHKSYNIKKFEYLFRGMEFTSTTLVLDFWTENVGGWNVLSIIFNDFTHLVNDFVSPTNPYFICMHSKSSVYSFSAPTRIHKTN